VFADSIARIEDTDWC